MEKTNGAYFGRSWALLTRDKGWIKPLLVCAAAMLVPIVGPLGVTGYAIEWARLTAWGVDAAPKQKNVQVGECIKSGWRTFLVGIGYGLAAAVLNGLINMLFGDTFFVGLLTFCVTLAGTIFGMVGSLRAAIYQRVGAGYQVNRIWEMIKSDPVGLAKVFLVMFLIGLAIGTILSIFLVIALIPMMTSLAFSLRGYSSADLAYIDSSSARYIINEVFRALGAIAPILVIVILISLIFSAFATFIGYTALGLWMRQFNVPAWGASEDPMPTLGGLPGGGQSYPQGGYAQGGYAAPNAPQQNTYAQPGQPYGAPQYGAPQPMDSNAAQYGQAPYGQQPYAPNQQPYGQQQPYAPQGAQPYNQPFAGQEQPMGYGAQPEAYQPYQAAVPSQEVPTQMVAPEQTQYVEPMPTQTVPGAPVEQAAVDHSFVVPMPMVNVVAEPLPEEVHTTATGEDIVEVVDLTGAPKDAAVVPEAEVVEEPPAAPMSQPVAEPEVIQEPQPMEESEAAPVSEEAQETDVPQPVAEPEAPAVAESPVEASAEENAAESAEPTQPEE